MSKFTRKDYMNKGCTHREYYAQFVNPFIKSLVLREIGLDRLLRSTDPHLNDIPLNQWGMGNIRQLEVWKEVGDFYSIAGETCILKEAARQLIEEES